MPIFIQLMTFSTQNYFDSRKDTKTLNEVLARLQQKGARIISISPSVAGSHGSAIAVYVITYEATQEIVM